MTTRAPKLRDDAVRLAVALVLSMAASMVARAEREFTPVITAAIARTDNVALAADGEQDETVYQVTPSFTFIQESARLSSSAVYQLDGYYYRDRGESEVFHRLDGTLRSELDRDNFFIDLGASRGQSLRDPRVAIPRGNLYVSSNRIDRDEAYLGPAFEYSLGGDATVSGSYRRTWIRYDDDDVDVLVLGEKFTVDTVAVAFDNYGGGSTEEDPARAPRDHGFTWAVRYESEETDYGLPVNWEYRSAIAEFGAWVGPSLRIFAAGGKESDWERPIDARLEHDLWEVGFERRIGRRFRALAAAGERIFGSSRRASLAFDSRRLGTTLNYTEQPKTQERTRLDSDRLIDDDWMDDLLVRPGNAERYLSKRLDWNLNLGLGRTAVLLRVFDETRERRARIDGTTLEDEAQEGAALTATRRVGGRTELLIALYAARREFGDVEERELKAGSVGARYSFSSRSQLFVTYEYMEEESSVAEQGSPGYKANLLQVAFRREF